MARRHARHGNGGPPASAAPAEASSRARAAGHTAGHTVMGEGVFARSSRRPAGLVRLSGGALRVTAVNPAAARAGATPGLTLAEARARHADLVVAPEDQAGLWRALMALARWAGRWSPCVAPVVEGEAVVNGRPKAGSFNAGSFKAGSLNRCGAFAGAGAWEDWGLALDVTGVAHMFGGEAALVEDIAQRFAGLGVVARVALASAHGAAWALARCASPAFQSPGVCPPGAEAAALDPLPVAALRLDVPTTETLRGLGLKTVGALRAQARTAAARAALARRVGPGTLRRLDHAFAREAEPIAPLAPIVAIQARLRFPEPVMQLEAVQTGAAQLAGEIAGALARRRLGARRMRLALQRVDGRVLTVMAGTAAPSRDAAHIARVLRIRLEHARLDAGFGVEAAHLTVTHAAPLASHTRAAPLPGGGGAEATAWEPPSPAATAALADRLSARLGAHAVRRAVFTAHWRPERASRWVSARAAEARADAASVSESAAACGPRPLLRLDPPEPVTALAQIPDGPPAQFRWRRQVFRVVCAEGPERIAPPWWEARFPLNAAPGDDVHDPAPDSAQDPAHDSTQGPALSARMDCARDIPDKRTRDYFHVETGEGRRFWLFRAGLYGGAESEGDPPRWYLHGLGAAP